MLLGYLKDEEEQHAAPRVSSWGVGEPGPLEMERWSEREADRLENIVRDAAVYMLSEALDAEAVADAMEATERSQSSGRN